jgi:hypothetical protein
MITRRRSDQHVVNQRLFVGRRQTAQRGSGVTREDLQRKKASLRDKIEEVLEMHLELPDVTEAIALRQDLHVQVGTPFLERICVGGR